MFFYLDDRMGGSSSLNSSAIQNLHVKFFYLFQKVLLDLCRTYIGSTPPIQNTAFIFSGEKPIIGTAVAVVIRVNIFPSKGLINHGD